MRARARTVSLSLSHTHTRTHAHTHIRTHTLSLTHTHSHTHTRPLSHTQVMNADGALCLESKRGWFASELTTRFPPPLYRRLQRVDTLDEYPPFGQPAPQNFPGTPSPQKKLSSLPLSQNTPVEKEVDMLDEYTLFAQKGRGKGVGWVGGGGVALQEFPDTVARQAKFRKSQLDVYFLSAFSRD